MLSWRAGVVYKPRAERQRLRRRPAPRSTRSDGNTGLSLDRHHGRPRAGEEPRATRSAPSGTSPQQRLLAERRASSAPRRPTPAPPASTPAIRRPCSRASSASTASSSALTGQLTDRWSRLLRLHLPRQRDRRARTPPPRSATSSPTRPSTRSACGRPTACPAASSSAAARSTSATASTATPTTRVAPGYTLFDAMASYRRERTLTLRLNVNNLADERLHRPRRRRPLHPRRRPLGGADHRPQVLSRSTARRGAERCCCRSPTC